MSEQPGANEGTGSQNTGDIQISNQDVKNHPLFQKLTNQLGELQRAEEQRKANEVEAQKAAEIKAAQEAGEFEKALKLNQQKIDELEKKHKKELTTRDLSLELTKAGATNDIFIAGALSKYDGETSITDFVAELKQNNESYFGAGKKSPKPPSQTPVSGLGKKTTYEDAKAIASNPKSTIEQKKEAWNFMAQNMP